MLDNDTKDVMVVEFFDTLCKDYNSHRSCQHLDRCNDIRNSINACVNLAEILGYNVEVIESSGTDRIKVKISRSLK